MIKVLCSQSLLRFIFCVHIILRHSPRDNLITPETLQFYLLILHVIIPCVSHGDCSVVNTSLGDLSDSLPVSTMHILNSTTTG